MTRGCFLRGLHSVWPFLFLISACCRACLAPPAENHRFSSFIGSPQCGSKPRFSQLGFLRALNHRCACGRACLAPPALAWYRSGVRPASSGARRNPGLTQLGSPRPAQRVALKQKRAVRWTTLLCLAPPAGLEPATQ